MISKYVKEGIISVVVGIYHVVILFQFNPVLVLAGFPFYVFFAKENFVRRIAISYAASVLTLMIVGKPPITFLFLLLLLILPVSIFLILNISKTHTMDLIILTSAFLLYQVIAVKIIKVFYKIDVVAQFVSVFKNVLEGYFKAVGNVELSKMLTEFLKILMPGFMIVGSITLAVFGYYIVKFVAGKLKIEKEFLSFSKLFMPKEVTAGVLIFFVLSLFTTDVNALYIVVSNMIIILLWLLFIQALSLTYAIITEKIRSPFVAGWLFAVLLIFGMQFFILMTFIGFLDLIVDFKKRKPKKVKL